MPGQSQTFIPDDSYLLVSDSNEVSTQYDSKKLKQSDLAKFAQDELFKKIGIMSLYLTKDMFDVYKGILEQKYATLNSTYQNLNGKPWSGRFKPVDGQVILIREDDFNEYNNYLGADKRKTLIEYLTLHWDIPSDYWVEQVSDCMLRGVMELDSSVMSSEEQDKPIKKQLNQTVSLQEDNIPVHMHHSSVTKNANIQCMDVNKSQTTIFVNGEIPYDMFYNDGNATGLSKNELQGVVDNFQVLASGSGSVVHDNLPKYEKFYAFIVHKN